MFGLIFKNEELKGFSSLYVFRFDIYVLFVEGKGKETERVGGGGGCLMKLLMLVWAFVLMLGPFCLLHFHVQTTCADNSYVL